MMKLKIWTKTPVKFAHFANLKILIDTIVKSMKKHYIKNIALYAEEMYTKVLWKYI